LKKKGPPKGRERDSQGEKKVAILRRGKKEPHENGGGVFYIRTLFPCKKSLIIEIGLHRRGGFAKGKGSLPCERKNHLKGG